MRVCNKAGKNTEQANLLKPQVLLAELFHLLHLCQKSQGSSGEWQPQQLSPTLSSSNPRQYASSGHAALSQVILRIKSKRTKFQIQTQS